MKLLGFLSPLIIYLVFISCSSREVILTSNFDHGSIGDFQEIEPGYFRGSTKHWLKRDSIGDQYYWFYFKTVGY